MEIELVYHFYNSAIYDKSTNLYASLFFCGCDQVTFDPLDQPWQMTPWLKEGFLAVLRDGVLS